LYIRLCTPLNDEPPSAWAFLLCHVTSKPPRLLGELVEKALKAAGRAAAARAVLTAAGAHQPEREGVTSLT